MKSKVELNAKLKVFISYSRKDLVFAEKLVAALEQRGIECRIDTRDLPSLEDWRRELLGFIREADSVVFIVSPNSIGSKVCAWEVDQVRLMNKRLAPVVYERVDHMSIPEAVAEINYLYFDQLDLFEATTDKLAAALKTDLSWVKEHTRLAELARRWDERGRSRVLMLRGQELEDAERWIASRPREAPEPTALHRDLILTSRRAARRSARNWLMGAAALALAGFTLAAVAAIQREFARESATEATRQRNQAIAQTVQAQKSQSNFQAKQANEALANGDASAAALLAIEALADPIGKKPTRINRPYVPEAEQALYKAWHNLREKTVVMHSSGVSTATFSNDGKFVLSGTAEGMVQLTSVDDTKTTKLVGHTGWIVATEFSPDQSRILTASADNTARLWRPDGSLIAVLKGHSLAIYQAEFSPDGKYIATASQDGTARIWNSDGKMLAELAGHTGPVNSAHFSPDGSLVVTTSQDFTAKLWTTQGRYVTTLRAHSRPVFKARFSPDGATIATAGQDSMINIWSREGKHVLSLDSKVGEISDIEFHPEGKYVLTDRGELWSIDGHLLKSYAGSRAKFSKDGQFVLVMTRNGAAEVLTLAGHPLARIGGHEDVFSGQFSPDGQSILTHSSDGTFRIWTIEPLSVARCDGHDAMIEQAAVSPDGRLIATASHDMTVRLWTWDCKPIAVFKGHTDRVDKVQFSPGGDRVLTAARDGKVILWTLEGNIIATMAHNEILSLNAVFSPDGNRIATESAGALRFWDRDGKLVNELKLPAQFLDLVFSHDGGTLAATTTAGVGLLYNPDGRLLGILEGHTNWLTSLRFLPYGGMIVTTSQDGTARIWLDDGTPLSILEGHVDWVTDALFLPDNKHVRTWSKDGTARTWTIDGKFVKSQPAPGGDRDKVTLMPGGHRILVRSSDGPPTLWSLDGELIAPIGEVSAYAVAVSKDGTKIFATQGSGDAKIFSIFPDTASLIAGVQTHISRCLSSARREQLLIATPSPDWCPPWPDKKARERAAQKQAAAAGQEAVKQLVFLAKAKFDNENAWKTFSNVILNGKPATELAAALGQANDALAILPSSPIFLDTRGQIYLAMGRHAEAAADLERAFAAGLESAGTFYALGATLEARGDKQAAIERYTKSATIVDDGSFASAYETFARAKSRERLAALGAPVPPLPHPLPSNEKK